jgi:4-hydroxybenzoate polyprenyltransferase
LIASAHPAPSLIIASIIVALAASAGAGPSTLAVFAVAALAAQLSIGWSNDTFDAGRDQLAGRVDKPIVTGAIGLRPVAAAAGIALGLSVVAGFAVGWWCGLVNVVMIASGWAYNAGLKATLYSGLLYIVGFGLIPVFAASALPEHPLPRLWTVGVAALLGLGAHFVNVLPDLAGDKLGGVRGLPQRLAEASGPMAVRVVAFTLLVGASLIVIVVRRGQLGGLAVLGLGLIAVAAIFGVRASGRIPFVVAIVLSAVNVALLIASGRGIVGV